MLIVVEGPDCAGKSTLIERLRRYIEDLSPNDVVHVIKSGTPIEHPLEEYVVPLLGYRPNSKINANHHIICDRLHWGERVYPAVLQRATSMDMAQWRYIEAFLQSRGALMVHLSASTDTLVERMEVRGDDLIKPDQLDEIRTRYQHLVRDSVLPYIYGESHTMPHLVKLIVDAAEDCARTAMALNRFTTYVGPRAPARLLLGDVRGPAFQTENPIDQLRPAFMPYPSMSGAYLWRALAEAPHHAFADGGIGVANACDVDDIRELHKALGRPSVVTLGANATHAFKDVATQVPHPQWVRRFAHHRIDEYGDQLLYGKAVAWN